jgi:hypothetical protein
LEINTEIKLLNCDMAVQHLTLWISNIKAVKSAMLMHERDIQASLKDYEQATGVGDLNMLGLILTQSKDGKDYVFKFLYVLI